MCHSLGVCAVSLLTLAVLPLRGLLAAASPETAGQPGFGSCLPVGFWPRGSENWAHTCVSSGYSWKPSVRWWLRVCLRELHFYREACHSPAPRVHDVAGLLTPSTLQMSPGQRRLLTTLVSTHSSFVARDLQSSAMHLKAFPEVSQGPGAAVVLEVEGSCFS